MMIQLGGKRRLLLKQRPPRFPEPVDGAYVHGDGQHIPPVRF